jgi:hypothetical protein
MTIAGDAALRHVSDTLVKRRTQHPQPQRVEFSCKFCEFIPVIDIERRHTVGV